MSRDIAFYRVSRITEDVPDVIITDKYNLEYAYAPLDDAAGWEKDIGIKRTIEYQTIDIYDACEKLFHKKAKSISYSYDGSRTFFGSEEDGMIGHATEEMLKPFYYTKREQVYLYSKEQISSTENGYLALSLKDGIVTPGDLLKAAGEIVSGEEEYYPHVGEALFAVMKAYEAAIQGALVCCFVD